MNQRIKSGRITYTIVTIILGISVFVCVLVLNTQKTREVQAAQRAAEDAVNTHVAIINNARVDLNFDAGHAEHARDIAELRAMLAADENGTSLQDTAETTAYASENDRNTVQNDSVSEDADSSGTGNSAGYTDSVSEDADYSGDDSYSSYESYTEETYPEDTYDNTSSEQDTGDTVYAADEPIYEETTGAQDSGNDGGGSGGDTGSSSGSMASQYNISGGIYGYSAEEAYLLACTVTAETGDSGYETNLACANVILDRAKREGSIYGAVYAPGQFSVAFPGHSLERVLVNGPSETALQATIDALNGMDNRRLPYYYFNNCDMGYTGEWIGNEYFYLID